MLDTFTDSMPTDVPLADLGPLAWVFDELRKSLDAANKAIRRFVRESEHARHNDLDAVDPASLRLARQQLHQAVGALEMVGLAAPAQVLRAMEGAVQRCVQRPQVCTEEAAARIEGASFALIEYLDCVLHHKPVQPVSLFSQYRDVQALAGAERVHPADLWPLEHRGIEVSAPADVTPLQCDPPLRSRFDRLVLLVLKTQSVAAAQQLARLSAGLSAGSAEARAQTFWRVAAAYFQVVAHRLVPVDMFVKRGASRILLQFANVARGQHQISETLLHDLLFFCAQAQPASPDQAPHLLAVREAFGLASSPAVEYQQATLGRYDPALLAQARRRIAAAKEAWSLFAGGDQSRARAVVDQFGLIGDSLLKLQPSSIGLAQALMKAADQAARDPGELRPELAMEVATTTLFLEAAFADFDPHDAEMAERTQALAARLDRVLTGAPAQPLALWMEELYRRVSDRQTMGSVVGELKVSLAEVEKCLDQFTRSPQDKSGLYVAVSQLAQMRGVLSVLGLEQAVQAVTGMRSTVDQMLDTEVEDMLARQADTFQQLGNNLSALGFLVDMLNYQPALARQLFVFDEDRGELLTRMGRGQATQGPQPGARQDTDTIGTVVQRVVEGVQDGMDLARLSQQLHTLADQASLAEQPGVARAARDAAQAVVEADAATGARALVDLSELSAPAMPPEPDAAAGEEVEEGDLIQIFLQEAREVTGSGLVALELLQIEPGALEHLTTVRRAFHTLKGSSRMVGLVELGEAARAMEQLLNAVLAEQLPAHPDLLQLAGEALRALSRWVEDIAQGTGAGWRAEPFRVSADAWREQGRYLPLSEPAPPAPADDGVQAGAAPDEALTPLDAGATADGLDAAPIDSDAWTVEPGHPEMAGEEDGAPLFESIDFDALVALSSTADAAGAGPADAAPDALPEADPPAPGQPARGQDIRLQAEPATAPDLPAAPADDVPDEQTRVIGSLRIGIRLYNVFLNEADEWSRRLCTELVEWSMERHEAVPREAEALAHSLAGSSAAVGFRSLSDIARALEHALESVALHQQAGQAATEQQAQLLVDASEDIRRLLHQFAAGFLKDPNTDLLAALYRVVHEAVPPEPFADSGMVLAPQTLSSPSLDLDVSAQWGAGNEAPWPAPTPADEVSTVFASLPEPSRSEARAVQDIDDDIDALDTIDIDLFPIFADEAQELLPRLGGALRQWIARPDNDSARSEVLRNLHTFKGSARLAGALRLGEMAHRMETMAERLGRDIRHSAEMEPLQTAFDALAARLEWLRHVDPASHGVAQRAPEQAAGLPQVPPVLSEPVRATPEPGLPVAGLETPGGGQPEAGLQGLTLPRAPLALQARPGAAVRVRPELLDRLMNQTGEVMITRSRMEADLLTLRGSLKELTGNLDRLRHQLRDVELQAESQMQSRLAQARDADQSFDPLEFDRFTRVQELTRMMAESVNDVATVQRNLQRAVQSTEDGLVAQGRQTRELQRDLLRTRMVEFEGISERLYRVVRQASKETGKQVRLDITGGHIEIDRGVLDRMTTAFEHLLRNSVVHGIESPETRLAAGKPAEGRIVIRLAQEVNDVSVVFHDDGAGLDLVRLRERAEAQGLVSPGAVLGEQALTQLVFEPGLSTAREVSGLAGRGIGMDVVRTEVVALGGRIETESLPGRGTRFKLVLPLTTAVTQVVMVRAGTLTLGVPSSLVELVRRVTPQELAQAYATGVLPAGGEDLPFHWAGALLQSSTQSLQAQGRTLPVVVFRSAAQRVAVHVDEVLGNQEVVVKNLGPQLSRLPGLAGMSVLASGAVALIYNPVALATIYGSQVRAWLANQRRVSPQSGSEESVDVAPSAVPLVLVVDDSITVRRVTQRLLQREGYRVSLAADGLQALERLQQERPAVVLSDIEMPRMDGFDLVRNIRNDPRLSGLPVIMITSRIAEKHRQHARELGVDHYLGKPYPEDELLALIAHHAQLPVEV